MPARSISSGVSPHPNNTRSSIQEEDTMLSTTVGGAPTMGSRRRHGTAESRDNLSADSVTPSHSPYNRYLSRYHEPYSNPDRRQRLTINVSGERYQTYVDTLERFPHTLLGNSESREKFYDDVEDEYFFDRDRNAFSAILYYYQSGGQLYCPLTLPLHILVTEATFFKLGTDALKQVLDIEEEQEAEMPKNKLQRKVWCLFEHPETSTAANLVTIFSITIILLSVTILCIETLPVLKQPLKNEVPGPPPNRLETHYFYRYRDKDQPNMKSDVANSTLSGKTSLNATVTNSAIDLDSQLSDRFRNSTTSLHQRATPAQLPNYTAAKQHDKRKKRSTEDHSEQHHKAYHHYTSGTRLFSRENETCTCSCTCKRRSSNSKNATVASPSSSVVRTIQNVDWAEIFDTCEVVFVIWFTIEYVARLVSSPKKLPFLKNYLNIIDLLSILPYYIMLALNKQGGIGLNFRIVRLVRVFRIFKLSRHSKGLQILGLTFNASMRELGLLIFFIAIGVVLFSSAIFYVETETNVFSSIPDAFWWAIVTMCTVGYGDKVPHTFWGKVIGSFCAVSGVLCIALPVPVIVSNFDYFYNRERTSKMHKHVLDQAESGVSKEPIQSEEATENDEEIHEKLLNNNDCNHVHATVSPTMSSATNRSPTTSRTDEIQRQSLIRNLEKRNRKLSQRLSQTSVHSPLRKNGALMGVAPIQERESVM